MLRPRALSAAFAVSSLLAASGDCFLSCAAESLTFETQGLSRFALAQYLLSKANLTEEAKRLNDEEGTGSRGDGEYWNYLESCEVNATRRQAETPLEETIAEFGEIPFVRARG